MSTLFIGRFVALSLALLMASTLHTHAQSRVLTGEDEADILESLLEVKIDPFGTALGGVKTFSSDNIASASATRLAKHGFSFMSSWDIQRRKQDQVIDYVIIRSIYLKDGVAVVRLSIVREGRPCFGPAFSTERSFTYEFEKTANKWVGRLVKRPTPFPFSKKLKTTP
jgi:hypothetical protein